MKISMVILALACAAAAAPAVPAFADDEAARPAFRSPAFPWDLAREGAPRVYAPEYESPQSALNRLERSYRDLDLELYASLLTADYRFITDDPRFDSEYPEGLDRLFDVSSSAGLFGAVLVPNKPRIRTIEFDLGLVGEGADPEHPDSLDHYRLLVTPRPVMTIKAGTAEAPEEMHLRRTLLAFYMVRGDAAMLPPGAPGTDGVWYLRRWVETPQEAEPLAADDAVSASAAKAGFALAQNPARGPFEIVLSLPSQGAYEIEIFDVAGRSLHRRPPAAFAAGETRLQLAESARLPAGIYWVRVSGEGRALATRVVTKL